MIECGHPRISADERERVRAVVAAVSTPVLAHARARREDIDAVLETGAQWVGLFASINAISLETKFKGMSREEVLELFHDAIRYARERGLRVRATVEDAARTSVSDLVSMIATARDAGADRICFADSVGILLPDETFDVLSLLRHEFPDVVFEYHVHNDRGLALGNTLAAIQAGVQWHSASCNGIGERAGITDTFQLLTLLHTKFAADRFNLKNVLAVSELVEAHSRIKRSPMHPVVGENAFVHVARLHQLAMQENQDAYSAFDPELINGRVSLQRYTPMHRQSLFLTPFEKSASELKYHRHGPGKRFVMLDRRQPRAQLRLGVPVPRQRRGLPRPGGGSPARRPTAPFAEPGQRVHPRRRRAQLPLPRRQRHLHQFRPQGRLPREPTGDYPMKQFDKHADAYNVVRGKIAYPDSLYRNLAERAPAREAALDIGCGNGVSTVRLQPWFRYVEGSDLGEALIAKARENYPEIRFSVSPAETFAPQRRFDLVTSATSFYWMDRKQVLTRMADWLTPGGLFCAYKYDFPIAYGPLRDFIEHELVNKWAKHRDPRLTRYDDTLEIMGSCPHLRDCRREVFANIIFLSPEEVALFFLSTSYVTRYIEQEGGEDYADRFIAAVREIESAPQVAVNFDIHAFTALNR